MDFEREAGMVTKFEENREFSGFFLLNSPPASSTFLTSLGPLYFLGYYFTVGQVTSLISLENKLFSQYSHGLQMRNCSHLRVQDSEGGWASAVPAESQPAFSLLQAEELSEGELAFKSSQQQIPLLCLAWIAQSWHRIYGISYVLGSLCYFSWFCCCCWQVWFQFCYFVSVGNSIWDCISHLIAESLQDLWFNTERM